MKSLKIAVTGASGFIGTHIRKKFDDHVVIKRDDSVEEIRRKLKDVHAVINLAGAPIIKRWSPEYKKRILNSRINTTRKIVRAINESGVKYLISTSAIGIYPDDRECDEDCKIPSHDFLGNLSRAWESEARKCNKKLVILRLGVVLGKEGGALKKMLLPFRLGLGGPIGKGEMFTSWIDIADLLKIYEFIMTRKLVGTFNAVSPRPVTNKELTTTLARVLKRPAIIPVPPFVLRIIYGEAASVLAGSKKVFPKRLLKEGFKFEYPDIEKSLRHILSPQNEKDSLFAR